jgi:glycosyltransferase involved in cell wall biosynthesis
VTKYTDLKKQILLVNQHTVPVFTDIVNAFALSGHDVILFTGHLEKGGQPLSSSVKVIKSIRYNRQSAPKRLLTWVCFTIHFFFYLMTAPNIAIVLVVTNPPLAPLITALAQKLKKFKFHVVLYDLYPEAFAQVGMMSPGALLYKWWQRANRSSFNSAQRIFTLSNSMKIAVSNYVSAKDNVRIVPNWADTSYLSPLEKEKNPFVQEHRLTGKFVILYAGNMGLTHDLESLLYAAEVLHDHNDIVFMLIGDGGKKSLLESIKTEKKLNNVIFLPYQNETNFPYAMASADIGIVTLGKGAEGISVPSKTYVNLAVGVCILAIAPADSELARLVTFHNAGIVCNPGDFKGVAKNIQYLAQDQQRLSTYKKNSLNASQSYTRENAKLYVNEVLNEQ